MTLVDFLSIVALAIAGASLALRGYMLKPAYMTWVNAPATVSFALVALSIILLGRGVSIYGGNHATAGEMVVCIAQAVVATIMLANLLRQKPPAGVLGQLLERVDEGARATLEAAARALGIDGHGGG